VTKIIVTKSKEVKTGCNLAESSKKGYGSKRAVLPVMMMMMTNTFSLGTDFHKECFTPQESPKL
jgi:hypothetical protein